MMTIGTRVRPSTYALRSALDWCLSQGRASDKLRARESYDRQAAKRGVVTVSSPRGLAVEWDDGSQSQCLDYMVDDDGRQAS